MILQLGRGLVQGAVLVQLGAVLVQLGAGNTVCVLCLNNASFQLPMKHPNRMQEISPTRGTEIVPVTKRGRSTGQAPCDLYQDLLPGHPVNLESFTNP